MGAEGWLAVSYGAFPAETVALYRLVKAGQIEEALKFIVGSFPCLNLICMQNLEQYIKLSEKQTGLGSEYVRAPTADTCRVKERETILKIINEGIEPADLQFLCCRPANVYID